MTPLRCLLRRHDWERWHGFAPHGGLVSCYRRCLRCPARQYESL